MCPASFPRWLQRQTFFIPNIFNILLCKLFCSEEGEGGKKKGLLYLKSLNGILVYKENWQAGNFLLQRSNYFTSTYSILAVSGELLTFVLCGSNEGFCIVRWQNQRVLWLKGGSAGAGALRVLVCPGLVSDGSQVTPPCYVHLQPFGVCWVKSLGQEGQKAGMSMGLSAASSLCCAVEARAPGFGWSRAVIVGWVLNVLVNKASPSSTTLDWKGRVDGAKRCSKTAPAPV